MSRLRIAVAALLGLGVVVYLVNSSRLAPGDDGGPVLLAHRGLHQTFSSEGLEADTCTAARIHPPEHRFLENTLASMQAAFDLGADVVEFDVHPTIDNHFVVFHDWRLDCRTDGTGVTREHTLADLKAVDIGYGYTADGGRTFPFRGSGIGAMPTLDEVLDEFPDKRLLIHVKSNDPEEGRALARRLAELPGDKRAGLMVYGGPAPIAEVRRLLPDVPVMSGDSLKRCVLRYAAIGWTGYVPEACRGTVLLLPVNVAPWLWGWPDRFLARMGSVSTSVFVTGPYSGGDFSSGIDDRETLSRLPRDFSGGIWTNRIDRIAPLVNRRLDREDQAEAHR